MCLDRSAGNIQNIQSPYDLLSFIRTSLASYALLALPLFDKAYEVVHNVCRPSLDTVSKPEEISLAVDELRKVDSNLEAMLLNHVTRRASKSQGAALLTLYCRAYAKLPAADAQPMPQSEELRYQSHDEFSSELIQRLKWTIRAKSTGMHGHLPVYFAVVCAALGLPLGNQVLSTPLPRTICTLDRATYLHLFVQARAILSSSVRLNIVGPYAAQRMLLLDVPPLLQECLQECQRHAPDTKDENGHDTTQAQKSGPVTTWPSGEILAGRHEQLHSRIFNS